ncbi:hypothetical protein [Nocardioides sp.]|uniref:beta strand repeat-containing protein n=1 Tax=Nocardioides sp. TaxID=35761 RepID=UPI00286A6B03|nr:hypothetical protein [Nocardioides sp.]
MKRGLAVSAISALALTGLAMTPAQAQTVGQGTNPLTLYSQGSGFASTRNDGNNTTVTLLAGFPNSIGANLVNSVRFSYTGGPIATVVPDNGVAAFEWAAPAGTWSVTVQALDNGNNVIATDTRPVVVTNGTNDAVDFANVLRAEAGQWNGEIVVRGTTSGDLVDVNAVGPDVVTAANSAILSAGPGGLSTFTGIVDIGANNTGDATDDVVVQAVGSELDPPLSGGDDVTVVTVYDQTVSNVAKALKAGSVVNVPVGSGANTTYVFTATDQKTRTIQGLDFYESDAAGAANDGNGDVLSGATDVNGMFEVTLNEADIDNGTDGDPAINAQASYYVVDVNENGTYENGTDFLFDVRQTRYVSVATTVTITNELGTAMDDEEDSNVTLLVKDQNGNPMSGATVRYKIDRVNLNPAIVPINGAYVDLVTGADGKATFNYVANNNDSETVTISSYVNNDGNPNPTPGDAIAAPYVIESDTTSVLWDNGSTAQALVGSTTIQRGSLVQDNFDNPLPNRPLDIDYVSGTGGPGNSILAPQPAQPAGTTRGSNFEANVVTLADGTFGVAVQDPAVPNGQELDAQLIVSSDALPNGLDTENDPVTLEIDFLRSLAPAVIRIINDDTGTAADGLLAPFTAALVPGGLGLGHVEAFNADGIALTDLVVNMSISQGNFVNIATNPFEPTPAPGAPIDFASAGKTIAVTTDDNGEGLFVANIERNTGFDDDGLVDDSITASAGGKSDSHDLTWTTNAVPLNPRAANPLVVALSSDQDSSILPQARAGDRTGTGQTVDYDASTFDQFGNPTSQVLNTTDNTPVAAVVGGALSRFALGQPAIQAFADAATSQTINVELTDAVESIYVDNPETSAFDPANPGAAFTTVPVDIEANTAAINWYELDYDASRATMSLAQQGPDSVPAGSAVTEVLTAIDQEGQPIEGMPVGFLRVGPSADGDSDGNASDTTNAAGQAFYDFAGNQAGTASITAVIFNDEFVRQYTVGPDNVTFTGGQPGGKDSISPRAAGRDKGRRDQITVKAPKAFGATVQLFRLANGRRVLVKTGALNATGVKVFTVTDKNGARATRYFAVVRATARTTRGTSNIARVQ